MLESDKNQLMFSLLQCSLFGRPAISEIEIPEDADWKAVLKEMKSQTVHGLVEPILNELPIDPETKAVWQMECIKQQARWYQVAAAQQELLELLEANNIPCVIIKGMAAAQYYPHPQCRVAGDVDFLVKRDAFVLTAKLLEKSGYELIYDTDYAPHHKEYLKDSVTFELHIWVGDDSDDTELLRGLLQSGVDQRCTASANGFSFSTFAAKQNGLVFLLHMKHHMPEGIALRQIVDWMLYVDKELTDSKWRELLPTLRQLGLSRFAAVLIALCRKYLGLQRELSGCETTESSLCDELMAHILHSGTFSVGSSLDRHVAVAFQEVRGPISLFRRLQEGGRSRWAAAKKHKAFIPFAWAYQVGYVTKQVLLGKKELSSVHRLFQIGGRQRDLIQKLGISEKDGSDNEQRQ